MNVYRLGQTLSETLSETLLRIDVLQDIAIKFASSIPAKVLEWSNSRLLLEKGKEE